jgi:hypothetical protein
MLLPVLRQIEQKAPATNGVSDRPHLGQPGWKRDQAAYASHAALDINGQAARTVPAGAC